MSVVRFPISSNSSVPAGNETTEETIAGHEALQAYCRSLNKLVELLGEQVEEIRVIHREKLVKNPSL